MISFVLLFGIMNFVPLPVSSETSRSPHKGAVYVAIYDSETTFMHPAKVRDLKILKVDNPEFVTISLAHLPPGAYAVSCFHDVNGNGILDTNMMGIPIEPYGFSNNARPMFRAPTWEEAKVVHPLSGSLLNIQLISW